MNAHAPNPDPIPDLERRLDAWGRAQSHPTTAAPMPAALSRAVRARRHARTAILGLSSGALAAAAITFAILSTRSTTMPIAPVPPIATADPTRPPASSILALKVATTYTNDAAVLNALPTIAGHTTAPIPAGLGASNSSPQARALLRPD